MRVCVSPINHQSPHHLADRATQPGPRACRVAMHSDHRRDLAQLIQHPQLAHVTGVEDELHAGQPVEQGRPPVSAARRHVCIGNQADARHVVSSSPADQGVIVQVVIIATRIASPRSAPAVDLREMGSRFLPMISGAHRDLLLPNRIGQLRRPWEGWVARIAAIWDDRRILLVIGAFRQLGVADWADIVVFICGSVSLGPGDRA